MVAQATHTDVSVAVPLLKRRVLQGHTEVERVEVEAIRMAVTCARTHPTTAATVAVTVPGLVVGHL